MNSGIENNLIGTNEYGKFIKITPIGIGNIKNNKYAAETECGKKYFIKITSDITDADKMFWRFEIQKYLYSLEVPMPKPVAMGQCVSGLYALYEYCGGDNLRHHLYKIESIEFYKLGLQIGDTLRRIHTSVPLAILHNGLAAIKKPPAAAGNGLVKRLLKRYIIKPKTVRFIFGIKPMIKCIAAIKIKYSRLWLPGTVKMAKYKYLTNPYNANTNNLTIFHNDYSLSNMMYADGLVYIVDFLDTLELSNRNPCEELSHTLCLNLPPKILSGVINGYNDKLSSDEWEGIKLNLSNMVLDLSVLEKNDGLLKRLWLIRLANILTYYDKMRLSEPTFHSNEHTESFAFYCCQNVVNLWLYFVKAENGRDVHVVPCLNYKPVNAAVVSADPAAALQKLSNVHASILAENIRLAMKNKGKRKFTSNCADCPNYVKRSWLTDHDANLIHIGVLPSNGYKDVFNLIRYMQSINCISPNSVWRMVCDNPSAHLYAEEFIQIAKSRNHQAEFIPLEEAE